MACPEDCKGDLASHVGHMPVNLLLPPPTSTMEGAGAPSLTKSGAHPYGYANGSPCVLCSSGQSVQDLHTHVNHFLAAQQAGEQASNCVVHTLTYFFPVPLVVTAVS
jgi:hypothetical protein